MCDMYGIAEQLSVIQNARAAADEILEKYYRIRVEKAYDLGNPRGFDRAVTNLSRQLKNTVSDSETDAVRSALKVLDVDWNETTATQRRSLIAASMRAAGLETAEIPALTEVVFGDAADDVVSATRKFVREDQSLKIGARFNALDRRITKYLKTSNSTFIGDEYGRRNIAFGKQAAAIVSDGLEAGLGRDAIARDLERAALNTIAGQGSNYWEVVSAAFIGRGRTYSQFSAYREANITRYVIEAVLDEVTTEICRFMHGKTFTVDSGIKLFEKVEANPDDLKEINPWVRTRLNKDGEQVLFVNQGDRQVPIATVEQGGLGSKDKVGSYRNSLSEKEMADLGASHPPFHGLCRTVVIPA